jgi:Restriction alleviation protein Lar
MSETHLLPCPFCGDEPVITGDTSHWMDDARYVQLSIVCCSTMTETIGWRRARDMTVTERDVELRARLTDSWNKRYLGD